jgi:hypothetical protein
MHTSSNEYHTCLQSRTWAQPKEFILLDPTTLVIFGEYIYKASIILTATYSTHFLVVISSTPCSQTPQFCTLLTVRDKCSYAYKTSKLLLLYVLICKLLDTNRQIKYTELQSVPPAVHKIYSCSKQGAQHVSALDWWLIPFACRLYKHRYKN